MAFVYQLKVMAEVLSVPSGISQGRRIFVHVILALFIIFIGAANVSAQDLGEVAREERVRKLAESPHEVHVSTNDDLACPKILILDDDAKISKEQVTPTVKSSPAEDTKSNSHRVIRRNIGKFSAGRRAREPVKIEAPPIEATQPDPQPVPLGDIARQYREQKFARQQQVRVEAQPLPPSHVYTNDDFDRPAILTPGDHEVFEAAQKKQPTPLRQKAPEIEAMQQGRFSPSLDDIARPYRRKVSIPEITRPNRVPFLLGMTALAAPAIARSVIRPPPLLWRFSRKIRFRSTVQRLTRPENFAGQTITESPAIHFGIWHGNI